MMASFGRQFRGSCFGLEASPKQKLKVPWRAILRKNLKKRAREEREKLLKQLYEKNKSKKCVNSMLESITHCKQELIRSETKAMNLNLSQHEEIQLFEHLGEVIDERNILDSVDKMLIDHEQKYQVNELRNVILQEQKANDDRYVICPICKKLFLNIDWQEDNMLKPILYCSCGIRFFPSMMSEKVF